MIGQWTDRSTAAWPAAKTHDFPITILSWPRPQLASVRICRHRANEGADFGELRHWKSAESGVLENQILVFGKVDSESLVARDE